MSEQFNAQISIAYLSIHVPLICNSKPTLDPVRILSRRDDYLTVVQCHADSAVDIALQRLDGSQLDQTGFAH